MKKQGQIEVELQDVFGSDRAIAEMAWTSSSTYQSKKTKTYKDVDRVVNMLADLGHSTPFEGVVFRFWMRIPIFTDRQHMTHRIASHSGQSARYRTMPSDFFLLPNDVIAIQTKAGIDPDTIDDYNKICTLSNQFYLTMLDKLKKSEKNGIITNTEYKRARELIRGVLPQSNMTERVTVMNLRSFANYQKLRNSEHAQPEIRILAQLMLEEVEQSDKCPIAIEALKRNNWNI